MKRVEADGMWPLFCPNEAKDLHEVWGEEFEKLFEKYEFCFKSFAPFLWLHVCKTF